MYLFTVTVYCYIWQLLPINRPLCEDLSLCYSWLKHDTCNENDLLIAKLNSVCQNSATFRIVYNSWRYNVGLGETRVSWSLWSLSHSCWACFSYIIKQSLSINTYTIGEISKFTTILMMNVYVTEIWHLNIFDQMINLPRCQGKLIPSLG